MPISTISLKLNFKGPQVKELHAKLDTIGIAVPKAELDAQAYGEGTQELVLQFQARYKLPQTGVFDGTTKAALDNAAAAATAAKTTPPQRRVEGRLYFEHGLPAGNIGLRLYHRGFGDSENPAHLASSNSDADGFYFIVYDGKDMVRNLEVWAVDSAGKEISISKTKHNAAWEEVMNLVVPDSVRILQTEYEQLTADLKQQLSGANLGNAGENKGRQDVTLLSQATGWDARLIALAATAHKLSAATETGIPVDALYGLFRAGLPMDKQQLAQVSLETVGKALEKIHQAGIVNFSVNNINTAKTAFDNFARATLRAAKAPGSLDSFDAMLNASGLPDQQKRDFEAIYFEPRNSDNELWEKARKKNIPEAAIARLRTQGKLAYLTLNNVTLTTALQKELGQTGDLNLLVERDGDKPETWERRLQDLAGDKDEDSAKVIPPAYVDEKVADRLNAYAADMARKVRLSFPTQVISRMIERDELQLATNLKEPVRTFLKNAEELGFELGRTPAQAFINDRIEQHQDRLFPKGEIAAVTEQVKFLQRLYQITPTNEAMQGLLNLGITSALDVVVFPRAVFIGRFGEKLGGKHVAELVYKKSAQVTAVVYGLTGMVRQMESAPSLYVTSAPVKQSQPSGERVRSLAEPARDNLRKHFPAMNSLFGSLDYCECEHCRSVLSPAAYFVDLLKFLDPDEKPEWDTFLNKWRETHGSRTYDSYGYLKPYDALIERRPDLPHLPLTCENTNTAMPYIDLANEVLEYVVAANDRKLPAASLGDTSDVTTPELLAEPQNVIAAAYNKLKETRYPLELPFDLWLETARRFCDHFEMPLWKLAEILRPTDELFAPTADPKPYYRADIFAEYLGLSPDHRAIFTGTEPLTRWFELYGYKIERDAITEAVDDNGQRMDLNSAKSLSRRLGVSYKELVELVRTGFVNPHLDSLVILRKLKVDVEDVFRYKRHAGYAEFTPEEQAAFEKRLDDLRAATGFDVRMWLDTAWANRDFNEVIVLADPDTGCNFDKTTLRFADGDAVDALTLLKLNLFVRLWRKLGWTIEETDRALQTFLPKNSQPLTGDNIGAALRTALVYLAHLKELDEKLKVGKNSRVKLLTLWGDLPTTGNNPLYAQLFLTRSVLKYSPVFDDPLCFYLSEASIARAAGLIEFEAFEENVPPGGRLNPDQLSAIDPAVKVSFDFERQIQKLSYRGQLTEEKKARLKAPFRSPLLKGLLDAVQQKGSDFFRDFPFIKAHLLTLQGALNLTADEIKSILAHAGNSFDTAPLSLENVSLLYRYGLLAKALKITVRELIALKGLTGINPFAPISPIPINKLADDEPYDQTLRFVTMAEQVKASGFSIEDLDYLLRHRFEPLGKYRPDTARELDLVKNLAAGIHDIHAAHAMPVGDDAIDAFTDEMVQGKLALVLTPDVVETFMGYWKDTMEFSAVLPDVAPASKLDPTMYQVNGVRVDYDQVRQLQRVSHTGVLTEAKRDAILTKIPAPSLPNFAKLLARIVNESLDKRKAFFDKHFAGFLTDRDIVLDLPAEPPEEERKTRIRNRRKKTLEAFLPFLRRKLTRQFVATTLASGLNADPALVETLLTNGEWLADPSRPAEMLAEPTPLLDAFAGLIETGMTAEFFASPDLADDPLRWGDPPMPVGTVATVNLTAAPTDTNSARWRGYLSVPISGPYRFWASLAQQNAFIEFRLGDRPDPVIRYTATKDNDEFSAFVELQPGVLYPFTVEARNLQEGGCTLRVKGEITPIDHLNQFPLYPQAAVERAQRARTLLAKTMQIIQGAELNESAVRYLLSNPRDFNDLNFGSLPTLSNPAAGGRTMSLFGQVLRLANYAQLRREWGCGDDDLIALFARSRHKHPLPPEENQRQRLADALFPELCQSVANLTRRNVELVNATVKQLGFTAVAEPTGNELRVEAGDFVNEKGLLRLWEALQALEKLGVPVDAVTRWTRIIGGAATPNERFEIASDLKDTVKARYESDQWLRVAQPIFDKLRQRQRDALVAYVIQNPPRDVKFESVNQLFEYFLIDPGMEPVVQTSRLRLAISSVQTFIQRCLLNLEERVPPAAINAEHWRWMKRYRVWEANRKIFLYPENWLEPEFRDDKTHLFQELEGALLQGDVSNDLAEDAFFNYLKNLDELARLEIVTMYCEEKSEDPTVTTLHVIGRTYSLPHKYFYRHYSHGMWTPWEPVTTEIEGDHVVAVVWRERLHLFWVTFLEKAEMPQNDDDALPQPQGQALSDVPVNQVVAVVTANGPQKLVDIQLNWSEYFQGQWTTRESGRFGSIVPAAVPDEFDRNKVSIHASNNASNGVDIYLGFHHVDSDSQFQKGRHFTVVSKNSLPEVEAWAGDSNIRPIYVPSEIRATQRKGEGIFSAQIAKHSFRQVREDGRGVNVWLEESPDIPILRQSRPFYLLQCGDPLHWNWFNDEYIKPFFYQDGQHTFFVEPTLTETPIRQYEGWGVGGIKPALDKNKWLPEVKIARNYPMGGQDLVRQRKAPFTDPSPLFKIRDQEDWVTAPGTLLQFDTRLISSVGSFDPAEITVRPGIGVGGQKIAFAHGSGFLNSAVDGFASSGSKLIIVGAGGLNASVLREINDNINLNAGKFNLPGNFKR